MSFGSEIWKKNNLILRAALIQHVMATYHIFLYIEHIGINVYDPKSKMIPAKNGKRFPKN